MLEDALIKTNLRALESPGQEEQPPPGAGPTAPATEKLLSSADHVRSLAIVGLFLIAFFAAINLAKEVVVPIVLAILLAFTLDPIVRTLTRFLRFRGLSAAVVLFLLLGAVGYGLSQLAKPAVDWVQRAPESLQKVESQVRILMGPAKQLNEMATQVQKLANGEDGQSAQKVEVASNGVTRVFSWTTSFLTETGVMFLLLFFMLAVGDKFREKLTALFPRSRDHTRAIQITNEIQESISKYLLTVTMINVGLGIVVWLAMWLVKMPNPALWGVMAGLMPFVPYLGAMFGISVLTLVAFTTFDNLGAALLPPGIYLVLACLEGGFVTPTILGKRLVLNPVAILLSVMFWGWLWGILGSILAVPILTVVKILCDHLDPLKPFGELLGR